MILVVDDHPAVLRSVARCLRGAGYQVVVAPNAERAIVLARQHSAEISVLLTDVVMRDCSGVELAGVLRQSLPRLKVLYMTGHVGASARSELTVHGAQVVMKPFDAEGLLHHIRSLSAPDVEEPRAAGGRIGRA